MHDLTNALSNLFCGLSRKLYDAYASGSLYVSPDTMRAQAILAILFANATIAVLPGRRASN